MLIEKLNTALYAYRKRIQGYELLKNPKDASCNEINMLKTFYGISEPYGDSFYRYTKLQRKKVNGEYIETTKDLCVTRFMDSKTKKITNKKNIHYYVVQNGQYVCGGEKNAINEENWQKREVPNWSFQEYIKNSRERSLNEKLNSYYQPHVSLLEKILTLGNVAFFRLLSGIDTKKPIKPSFTQVLLKNLKLLH